MQRADADDRTAAAAPPSQRRRRTLLLLLVLLASCGVGPCAGVLPQREQLEAEIAAARAAAGAQPGSPERQLRLAVALHHANDAAPDGGSRVAEAEAAYKAAIARASPAAAAAVLAVRANLAALLLSAARAGDALAELDAAIAAAAGLGVPRARLAALLFNRGKALSALGRLREADAAYLEAARAGAGRDLATYGKALAAARALPARVAARAERVARRARTLMAARPGLEFLKELEAEWPAADDKEGGGEEEARQQQVEEAEDKDAADDEEEAGAKSSGDDDDEDGDEDADDDDQDDAWLEAGSAVDLSWLHFALFKRADRARRFSAAWAALAAGNRLMAAGHGAVGGGSGGPAALREAEAARQVIEALPGPFPDPGGGADWSRGAIFVVGFPRSGSTLIEQMLGRHSRAYAAGEDTLLAPLAAAAQRAAAKERTAAGAAAAFEAHGRRYLRAMRARARRERGSGGGSAGGGDGDGAVGSGSTSGDEDDDGSGGGRWPEFVVDKMLVRARAAWVGGRG